MRFQCPQCKNTVSIDNADMGTTAQCGQCGKTIMAPASRTDPGCVIGDFLILREIGRGGMGIVYLAHQLSLDRPAALKILAENYARNADFVVGFIKEARAAAKLNHPNIVQAYAVGEDEGIFYFAMEHIDGETSKSILDREKVLAVDKASGIIQQVAEALDYAWQEAKLVHRDIKPDNIMLTTGGRAKLADLGLAKVGGEIGESEGEDVMGTPQYISPEQLTGGVLDNRSDIYSLGATFYHFITGRFPYEGASALEITRQHLYGTLIPPDKVNPDVPPAVARIVEKMMAKAPDQRYQNAALLAEDLALVKRGLAPVVATASGSLRVRDSNRNEAANQPLPPKLHMPEKLIAKTRSGAMETGTGSGVLTQSPGKKNKSGAAANKKAGKGKSGRKKSSFRTTEVSGGAGKIVAALIVLLLLAGAGAASYFHFVKKIAWRDLPKRLWPETLKIVKKPDQKTPAPPVKKGPSALLLAANPVVKLIRLHGMDDPQTALAHCERFLALRLTPKTAAEQQLVAEIVAYFAAHDEEKVDAARREKCSRYEAEQQRRKAEAAEAERRRQETAARRRREDAIRQAERAERERKERERLDYRKRIAGLQRQMLLDLVSYGEKGDQAGLEKMLKNNAGEVDRAKPALAFYARPLAEQAKSLLITMSQAWEWDRVFTSGDPALKELDIEIKPQVCKVTEIRNGMIHAADRFGKVHVVAVQKILSTHSFRAFAIRAGRKIKKMDTLPYYFFWKGDYKTARFISENYTSDADKAKFSRFLTEYLKAALTQGDTERKKLKKKFGSLPEYKNLVR